MIMFTFKRIAVSNWGLYQKYHKTDRMEDYAEHLAQLEQREYPPDILILREKGLTEEEYAELLDMVDNKLANSRIELIPHTYLSAAKQKKANKIHLPFSLLKQYTIGKTLHRVELVGTSIHSVEEAVTAQQLRASYVTAGHIFSTECKPGLEPRGLEFLEAVCKSVSIPVYAIGGIHPDNIEKIKNSGAAGACMMSEYMR